MEKLIFQGAEAKIFQGEKYIIKQRQSKSYRIPQLDKKLIFQRTRKESKLLEKASQIINVPKIANVTPDTIVMEDVKAKRLADFLEKTKNKKKICKNIGMMLARLHDFKIIHGDLTTSNILYNKKVFFVDFGLGFESSHEEDKAIDIHVFKEALESKHPSCAKICFESFIDGYKASLNSSKVLKRLEIVEKRGRYKQSY